MNDEFLIHENLRDPQECSCLSPDMHYITSCKVNCILGFAIISFCISLMTIAMVGTMMYHAYDIKIMYDLHKDHINETMDSVYRISTHVDKIMDDIHSFLEFKVVNAVCAYDKMPQVIRSYLCPDNPVSSISETKMLKSGERRNYKKTQSESPKGGPKKGSKIFDSEDVDIFIDFIGYILHNITET